MSAAKLALLPDRGIVSVTGEDARKLLGGVITNDIDSLPGPGRGVIGALHSGLLSAQGKIQFDFFVIACGDGLLLDVAKPLVADLIKRLTLYKLRAKATIRDESDLFAVVAAWSGQPPPSLPQIHFNDPRHTELGARCLALKSKIAEWTSPASLADGAGADYHAHRIALGVPEGGADYDFGDAFPHEANFDLLHGVSFEKGCYVGQEIVARMEHRGTVRKRIVRVTGTADLPLDRPDVVMGDVVIGRLGSVAGNTGLAMLRLDRAIEAIDKDLPITVAGIALVIDADMIARQRKLIAEKAAQP